MELFKIHYSMIYLQAYKQKVYGKQYVWFLIGWYEDDWYTFIDKTHNCTVQQMKEALEGHLTTEALMLNQGSEPTISGMVSLFLNSRALFVHSRMQFSSKKIIWLVLLLPFIVWSILSNLQCEQLPLNKALKSGPKIFELNDLEIFWHQFEKL